MSWYSYRPYVSVAQRRAEAAKKMSKLAAKGRIISPVQLAGKKIACTFWGQAWCRHLESYSDYANRLPRGRSYVRNGSVVDLQIKPGQITAMVSGSSLYDVQIDIDPLRNKTWEAIKQRCAGQIGSMIELLQGRLSEQVMTIITDREQGLFPAPAQIKKSCSCPDWADMCKHVAAALYGVGNRLDQQPQLLFTLRNVDHLELLAKAADMSAITADSGRQRTVATDDLADVFGIEMDAGETDAPQANKNQANDITAAPDKAAKSKAKPSAPTPAIIITTKTPPRPAASDEKPLLAKKRKKKKARKAADKTPTVTAIKATAGRAAKKKKKKTRRKAKPVATSVVEART